MSEAPERGVPAEPDDSLAAQAAAWVPPWARATTSESVPTEPAVQPDDVVAGEVDAEPEVEPQLEVDAQPDAEIEAETVAPVEPLEAVADEAVADMADAAKSEADAAEPEVGVVEPEAYEADEPEAGAAEPEAAVGEPEAYEADEPEADGAEPEAGVVEPEADEVDEPEAGAAEPEVVVVEPEAYEADQPEAGWAVEADDEPVAETDDEPVAEESFAEESFAEAEPLIQPEPEHETAEEPAAALETVPVPAVELRPALEAILLVVDEPVTEQLLAQVLEQPVAAVTAELESLMAEYAAQGRGFDLRRAAGGWRLYTRPEYAAYVERFVLDGQSVRLTQAALETLAVVAYKQPVTRSRISAIRGVNCDGVVRTLVTRGLIEEIGTEPETGAYLYRTSSLFLEKLGLDSVEQLPPLAPFLPDNVDEIAGDVQR